MAVEFLEGYMEAKEAAGSEYDRKFSAGLHDYIRTLITAAQASTAMGVENERLRAVLREAKLHISGPHEKQIDKMIDDALAAHGGKS